MPDPLEWLKDSKHLLHVSTHREHDLKKKKKKRTGRGNSEEKGSVARDPQRVPGYTWEEEAMMSHQGYPFCETLCLL